MCNKSTLLHRPSWLSTSMKRRCKHLFSSGLTKQKQPQCYVRSSAVTIIVERQVIQAQYKLASAAKEQESIHS